MVLMALFLAFLQTSTQAQVGGNPGVYQKKIQRSNFAGCFCKVEPVENAFNTPNPQSLFRPQKRTTLSMLDRNDDPFLGMVDEGDDFGDTNGLAISLNRVLKNRGVLSMDFTGRIYTHRADALGYEEQGKVAYKNGFVKELRIEGGDSDENKRNQFIDVLGGSAHYESPGRHYYRIGGGYYRRRNDRNPNGKLPINARVQDQWHAAWKNISDMYQHDYVSPDGKPGFEDVEMINNVKTAYVDEGYTGNDYIKNIARFSVELSVDLGTRKQFFRGQCELQAEVGFQLATEGSQQVVGQNSYARTSLELRTGALKTVDGRDRLMIGTGGELRYFPTSVQADDPQWGQLWKSSIQSNHYLGRRGRSFSPFMVFYVPGGRQLFHHVNDLNMIQEIGFKIIF